ncbi:uncharacterized protein [Diadema antillarum]|uniref:uncharacterized protein n=1 Tax=Diadema antillarum TaxID=105358 RepID=UPI003A83973C
MADLKNNVKGINVSALRRPIPTYQHYVEHFEELYRQSPLAKVIHKDVFPGMVSTSAPQTRASAKSGLFKVPFASPQGEKHSASTGGVPPMSPVAQLFHQMKKKGTTQGQVLHSRGKETDTGSRSSIPKGKEDKQKEITPEDEPSIASHSDEVEGTRGEDGSQEQTGFEAMDMDVGQNEDGGEMDLENQESRHDQTQSKFVEDTQKAISDGSFKRVTRSCKAKAISKGQTISLANHLSSVPETPKESAEPADDGWTETPKTSKKTETVLDQWIIKWLGSSHKHVSVEGHREEDPAGAFWHSTAISVRISSRVVETSSGSRYRLKGNINKLLTIDQGFSPRLVQRFQKGFPSNWKELLQQEAKELSTESDVSTGSAVKGRGNKKEKKATIQKSKAGTKSATPARRKARREGGNETKMTTPQTLVEKTGRELGAQEEKSAKSSARKTQTGQKNSSKPATPTCININDVEKTRSGRKIIPPLQFWSGQRQRSIPALNDATEILEGSIDYTPVSVTGVRLQGSIKISKREERLFKRLGKTRRTRHGKSRNESSLDRSSQSDVTDSDLELTSSVESEDGRRRTSKRKAARERTSKMEVKQDRVAAKEKDVVEEQVLASSPTKQESVKPSRAKGQESDAGDSEERITRSRPDRIEKNLQSDEPLPTRRTPLRLCNNHAPQKSPREVEERLGDVSVSEMSKKDQQVSTDKSGSHNRYDLYGAVMGVVEKHRQHRLSRSSRRSRDGVGQGDVSKSRSSDDCSYSVSDDEDFSSDISSAERGKKSQRSSARGVKGTKDTSKTQPLSSAGTEKQAPPTITNESSLHRHRRTKKYSQQPLLGSNMLPTVLLNRADAEQTRNNPKNDEKGETEKTSDQTKTSHSQTDHQDLSREKENSDVDAISERNIDSPREISKQAKRQKSVQRGKPKADESSESQQQKDVEIAESRQISDETPRARVSRKKKTVAHPDAVERGEKWSPDEMHRLQRALKMIPPSSNQFWLRVASSVGTKTDWECQQMHQAKLTATSKSSTKPRSSKKENQKAAKEPVTLTAAKGTMRRKRQLKEFIEQHNQNYDDNLFDSTPFKKQKVTKKTLLNLDLDDDDEEEEEEEEEEEGVVGKTPGTGRMKTPSTRLFSMLAPLSGKKTPHSTLISPGLLHSVERKHTEQYIHGIQKKKPVRGKAKKSPETTRKIAHKKGGVGLAALNTSVVDAFQIEPIMEHDVEEDGEADYYWSDDD